MLTGRAGRSEHDVELFVGVQSVDRRERPVLGRTVGRNDHDAGPFNTRHRRRHLLALDR